MKHPLKTPLKTEIIELIKIGLNKPKFYKRSVWNKSVKVMRFLSCHTDDVRETNFGEGLEKYETTVELTNDKLASWALMYMRSL